MRNVFLVTGLAMAAALGLGFQTGAAATLYATGVATPPVFTQSALYTVDPVIGAPVQVGGMDTHLPWGSLNSLYNGGLAYDPFTDRLFAIGVDNTNISQLYEVNRANGDLTVIGSPTGDNAFASGGLTFDIQTRTLYAVGLTGTPQGGLWEIDEDTGAGTFVGYTGTNGQLMYGAGCDPRTGVLYANGHREVTGPNGEWSALFILNKATGHADFVGYHGVTLGRQLAYSGLAFHPVTGTMYSLGSVSASQQALYTVDKATGLATVQGAAQSPTFGVDGGLVFVGTDILTAVVEFPAAPVVFRALGSPSNREVVFAFSLEREAHVTIDVFDVGGRRVAQIDSGSLDVGPHRVPWDGAGRTARVAAGIYFAKLRADNYVIATTKLSIVR